MKILWITNIILPAIAAQMGEEINNREGWLSGTFNNWENSDELILNVAFPIRKDKENINITVNGINCYSFKEDLSQPEIYDDNLEAELKGILAEVKPDVIHIFGTEFPHALALAKVVDDTQKILLGIQGVCSLIAKDYFALLPQKVVNRRTFRDILKKDSIIDQQNKFINRGENEVELIKRITNITGRTDFDKAFVTSINEKINYYHMNETMRSSFYEGFWDYTNVIPHSIFIGQGDYPIKGMHFLLKAAKGLIAKYPDLTINIAGNSIINANSLKDIIKTPSYGKYLRELINEYGLKGHINALGALTESQMKEQYQKSSVFVCASYVENSPNTLAEAMLLGMPIVTSNAGGIKSMLSANEGFIFARGDADTMEKYIDEVFTCEDNNDPKLLLMCKKAQEKARILFDGSSNHNQLIDIYKDIYTRNLCR